MEGGPGYRPPPSIADPPAATAKKGKGAALAVGLLGVGLMGLGGYIMATGYWVEEGQVTQGSCRTQYVRMPYPFKDYVDYSCTPGRIVKWPETHTARATAGVVVTAFGGALSVLGFRKMRR